MRGQNGVLSSVVTTAVTGKRESMQLQEAADDGGLCSKFVSYRGTFGREMTP